MAARARTPKYEKIANDLAHLIEIGTFPPGSAIPSVRELSAQREVSVTTVLQAYYQLEARGLIEARPRSGFYVSTRLPAAPLEPECSSPLPDPAKVSLREMVTAIWRDARDPDLIPMGVAHPSQELSSIRRLDRIRAAIAREKGDLLSRYPPLSGCPELKTQVARLAVRSGCKIRPEELIITAGCSEAINLCLRAVTQPGDTVAIESPICFDLLQSFETLRVRALEIPTHPQGGISLDALSFAVDNNPVKACIVISNYNNPLGSCIPDQAKRELVRMLAKREIPLIEIDIFGELHFGSKRPSVAKAYDQKRLVMLCSSFSKNLSAGLRVGWVAPGRFREKVEWLKYSSNIATEALPQLTIAEFMGTGGFRRHLGRVRQIYERSMAALRQTVIRYFPEGIRVTRPSGGYILWIQLPETVDSLELYHRALQHGVAITPGYLFSATDRYKNFIRLNACRWSDEIRDGVRKLGRMVRDMAE